MSTSLEADFKDMLADEVQQPAVIITEPASLMALRGKLVQVKVKNYVSVPDVDRYILSTIVKPEGAVGKFDHPNVLVRRHYPAEMRRYYHGGGKRWFTRLTMEYVFVIPAGSIFLLPEEGGGYPPVVIADVPMKLSCTGGTANGGWTDWLRPSLSAIVSNRLCALKALASVALAPAECLQMGLQMCPLEDYKQKQIKDALCRQAGMALLKPGMRIVLAKGCSWAGDTEFKVERVERRHRRVLLDGGCSGVWARYGQIDWTASIPAGVSVEPVSVVRVPIQVEPAQS